MSASLNLLNEILEWFDEKIQHHFVLSILATTSQNLVSRILLPYKSLHNNRGIFCDEMELIFYMSIIAKARVKKLTDMMIHVVFTIVHHNQY